MISDPLLDGDDLKSEGVKGASAEKLFPRQIAFEVPLDLGGRSHVYVKVIDDMLVKFGALEEDNATCNFP